MMFDAYNSPLCCEMIIFACISLICIIFGIDYNFHVLPFGGIMLIIYLLAITVSTMWFTFIYLQNLLRHNKPFEYDLEKNYLLKLVAELWNSKRKQQLTKQKSVPDSKLQELDELDHNPPTVLERRITNIDERIEEFVKDIEVRFILKWYVNISEDPSFPNESKVLLDEIVRRFLQIVVEVDGKKLVYGCIVVFLKHVKEFRKTIKRSQKADTGGACMEELYRYSHVGSKSYKALDHFIHSLTASILRQFINWELWNSLPCRSLVSILARKFTAYILTYAAAPGFLNYQLLKACASEESKRKLQLEKFYFVSLSDVDHTGNLEQLKDNPVGLYKETIVEKLRFEDGGTPKASPKKPGAAEDVVDAAKVSEVTETPKDTPEDVLKDKTFPDEKPDNRPESSEPVKIYESKSSSNKTWRNSSDLECISLGQDLLAFQEFSDPNSQIQELIGKKLWKDTTDGGEDERPGSMWDIPESWYGEEAAAVANGNGAGDGHVAETSPTDFKSYLKSSANPATLISNTMKPIGNVTASTLHNMKELQQTTVNTVNNVVKPVSQAATTAMHKVGDLQDEAAGMVEGILDFGMAGLRKGLRLTGLQENLTELTQKAKNEFQKPETARGNAPKPKPTEPVKIVAEKKVVDTRSKVAAKLVKTPHISSEEKIEQTPTQSSSESDESIWINPLTKESPSFEGDILLERTPDSLPKSGFEAKPDIPLITEDVLLTVDSPDPEYEEAQDLASTIAKLRNLLQQKSSESGFTTPALSPMPQDELAKTPAEPPPVVAADLAKVDGAMPSLYKFCARTATGVFQNTLNTIKTALPGNVNESSQSLVQGCDDWTFVEADACCDDFQSRMRKLLSERQAFCTVDTACEAIDSLDIIDHRETVWTSPVSQFDDELDEFDLQVPITKAIADVMCELISDTNTCLLQESVVKTILLLVGNYTEELVTKQSESLLHNVNKIVGKLPENVSQDVVALKLDEMVRMCMEVFPGSLKKLVGESTLEAGLKLLITSLQSQRINQDVFMQMLELFASQLISACSQVSPAYSA